MKFVRVLKAGRGAGLTLTNFELKFTKPIKLTNGYRGEVNPNSIKIVSFDVIDSDENLIGNFGEDMASVVDAELNFGYTIKEPIENGDNPIKVDTLIQNEPIEEYIGKGQWTYEYLKKDNIYEVHSDGCVMCFDYGYTADLSIWLKIKLDGANLLNILNEQDVDEEESWEVDGYTYDTEEEARTAFQQACDEEPSSDHVIMYNSGDESEEIEFYRGK